MVFTYSLLNLLFLEKNYVRGNSTASSLIWAVTLVLIVAIIAGVLYYSGFLGGTKKEKIDINVSAPSVTNK